MTIYIGFYLGMFIWALVVSSRRRAVKRDLIGACALIGSLLILLLLLIMPSPFSQLLVDLFVVAFFVGPAVSVGAVVWAHVGKSEIQPRGFPIEPLRSSRLESEDEIPK